jgi:hypothetical protein
VDQCCNEDLSLDALKASAIASDVKVGGRLTLFWHKWLPYVNDPTLLNFIRDGITVDFISTPTPQDLHPIYFKEEEIKVIDSEIEQMLLKNVIQEASEGVLSNIFVIQRKDKLRPVWDGRHVNSFIPQEHFQMEGLQDLRELLKRGDYMTVLDLKDAYYHLAIHPSLQPYMQFRWKTKIYQYLAMAFGLSVAPRIFTKLLKPIVALFRSWGYRCIIYRTIC